MVKNNHLALLADREEEAVGMAAQRAWAFRHKASFLEIEVRSLASAVAAARAFRELQRADSESESCPCLLLLDNMTPQEMSRVADALRDESLLDHVLLEASGNVTEENLAAYASCGIDAISMGALTHSARALDLSQTLFSSAFRNATHTATKDSEEP
jgi:nicotinate-nucleotide pyrophosphorylase (carboxylating)